MTRIRFGLVVPTEIRDPRHLAAYAGDAERALRLAADGAFDSAWMVDHLQFGDTAVLELPFSDGFPGVASRFEIKLAK